MILGIDIIKKTASNSFYAEDICYIFSRTFFSWNLGWHQESIDKTKNFSNKMPTWEDILWRPNSIIFFKYWQIKDSPSSRWYPLAMNGKILEVLLWILIFWSEDINEGQEFWTKTYLGQGNEQKLQFFIQITFKQPKERKLTKFLKNSQTLLVQSPKFRFFRLHPDHQSHNLLKWLSSISPCRPKTFYSATWLSPTKYSQWTN